MKPEKTTTLIIAVTLAMSLLNLSLSLLPVLFIPGSDCYVTAMYYCYGSKEAPVYISVFDTLATSYVPLFIASIIATILCTARLLGFTESTIALLTPLLLLPPSLSFTHIFRSIPLTGVHEAIVGFNTTVIIELNLVPTPLAHYIHTAPLLTATTAIASILTLLKTHLTNTSSSQTHHDTSQQHSSPKQEHPQTTQHP